MGLGVQALGAIVTEEAVGRHLVGLDHVGPQLCLGHLLEMNHNLRRLSHEMDLAFDVTCS